MPTVVHRNVGPSIEERHVPTVVHRTGPGTRSAFEERRVYGLRGGRIADHRFYGDIHRYHDEHYRTHFDARFARDPRSYHGYWGGGYYHGYWHGYWENQPWVVYGDHYGFWLNVGGVSTFVTETSPGTCAYWNGEGWVAWYNPPYTPYGCPY